MDAKRRKALIEAYKARKCEMGIVTVTCKYCGELYALAVKDAPAAINSHRFRLEARMHENKDLQSLWDKYGSDAFSFSLAKRIECKDDEDCEVKLSKLLEDYLDSNPGARSL